jgi:hypothetical protein
MSNEIQMMDEHRFAMAQRQAKALASSSLVPAQFQNNLANVLIAIDMAERLGASPMMVMQNLYIVHGKPGWSAQFLIATLNKSGKFSPLRYDVRGDDPDDKGYRVRAVATDRESGEACEGPWVTWKLVKAEGWDSKSGSKWKSMPDMMFRYRAAAFWVRLYSPETAMGIHTSDEVEDYMGTQGKPAVADSNAMIRSLKAAPVAEVIEAEVVVEAAPVVDDDWVPDDTIDPDSMTLSDLIATVAGTFDREFDEVLFDCVQAIGSKATSVKAMTDAEIVKARAWCVAQMGGE